MDYEWIKIDEKHISLRLDLKVPILFNEERKVFDFMKFLLKTWKIRYIFVPVKFLCTKQTKIIW